MSWEVGKTFKREGTYVYPWLIHVDIWQKPKEYCNYLSIKNKLIRKTRVLRVIPGILEAMGIATAVLSCKIQAHVLLPFGCHVEMLANTQAFQGTLNPHSRKHNCLDHFISSPLCFSSHEGIYLSFL